MNDSRQPVIVSGARTPMGRLLGSLKDFSAADLGGVAIKAALERAGISGDQVDYVIMGQVLQAGAGQIPARQAAVAGGIPMSVPVADDQQGLPVRPRRDRAGRPADPRRRVRHRRRRRHGVDDQGAAPAAEVAHRLQVRRRHAVDSMAHDGLTDTFDQVAMGELTEQANSRYGPHPRGAGRVRRRSHQRAAPRLEERLFDDEITPVEIPQRKGDPIEFREDEGIRPDTTVESLAKLQAGVRQGRHDHRRLASQISDGACAVVVMSAGRPRSWG
jgi:acetyl-CoA C-acetyltransferase